MDLTAEEFGQIVRSLRWRDDTENEHRRAPRVAQRAHVQVSAADEGKPARCIATDLSARGIAIQRREAMAVGEQFIVHLPRNSGAPLRILCTVVHCREVAADLYTIGAEFTCVLSEEAWRAREQRTREVEKIRRSIVA